MKYAVLADLHLGSGLERRDVGEAMQRLRDEGYTLVLAGDVFDLWREKDAAKEFSHLLGGEDIVLRGNHDHDLDLPGVRVLDSVTLESGWRRFFVTHGDVVDFVYGFAKLEHLRSTGAGRWWERLLANLRRWKAEDVYSFYDAMKYAPEWAVHALEHGGSDWRKKLQALAVLVVITLASFQKDRGPSFPHRPSLDGGVLDQAPEELCQRILGFYPEAEPCDTVIMGHLHRPARHDVVTPHGRRYELVVLGAWVKGSAPTVALIHEGRCEVRSV